MGEIKCVVIGGGIVGLATAYAYTMKYPEHKVVLLEKENRIAAHQSSHNSGVIHSGVYYKPGSLKARLCQQGRLALIEFCQKEGIPYEICGKVIVATTATEIDRLRGIHKRGEANGILCTWLDEKALRIVEPEATGVAALHITSAGITDYATVCQKLATKLTAVGHEIMLGVKVKSIEDRATGILIRTINHEIEADLGIVCAGLQADRLLPLPKKTGLFPKIIPFRGEYYVLRDEARHLCKHLVYPVPNPDLPFLGVHFTRRISGEIDCGPNAVLAFAREGYRKRDVDRHDFVETLRYPGFVKLARKYWRTGLEEMWRSWNKQAFLKALQKLVPAIRADDLVPTTAGVRAQAVAIDGSLVDDFTFHQSPHILYVLNAPSPAATAAFSIGTYIVDRLSTRL